MAVVEGVVSSERRARLGWRAAAAFLRRREASIFVVGVGLTLFFYFKNSVFLQSDNIKNVSESMAPIALVGAGEVMLLVCGEIDLAVGKVFALAPAMVWLISSPDKHHLPIWVGVILALVLSALVGLVNGIITTVFRVHSYI